jgi:hypothetical protein
MTRSTSALVPTSRVADRAFESRLRTGPFHVALRAAIRRRGLTLERLRFHLARRGVPIALSTLSEWQQGHARPRAGHRSAEYAVPALEEILGVPVGSLARLLRSSGGRWGADPVRDDDSAGPVVGLLEQLPGPISHDLDVLARQDRVRINARRRADSLRVRCVVRARDCGARRRVLRYFGDPGASIDAVEFRSLRNCQLGEIVRHPSEPILVAELLFARPLCAGETWVFEYTIAADPCGPVSTEYVHGVLNQEEHYLVEVAFDPAALPSDCHAYVLGGHDGALRDPADLMIGSDGAVHYVESAAAPGWVGIAWSWPS